MSGASVTGIVSKTVLRDAAILRNIRRDLPDRVETTSLGDLGPEELSAFDAGYNMALRRVHDLMGEEPCSAAVATEGKIIWRPIAEAPRSGARLMLWDSVSKRPVFGSWRGDNPAITHYAAEPASPENYA